VHSDFPNALYIYSVRSPYCTYESKGFCRFSVGTGTKKDESSTGRVWAAVFHHVRAHSHGARFETYEPFIYLSFKFCSGSGKPRILNQWIRGHDCIAICRV
jgi:hypothetical protein